VRWRMSTGGPGGPRTIDRVGPAACVLL
jgi:hypothetical protein